MPLQKQPLSINFSKGLDTKSDPFQVQLGNFLSLSNSVFTTSSRLTKRNGFENITQLPNALQTNLTTLNDNLIATGSNLYAFSPDTNTWLNKGTVQPVQLSVQPLVRVSTSQSSPDSAISASGLVCLAYMDNGVAYYQVSDSATGNQILPRTMLTSTAAAPKVFLLGSYFIITFLDTISATTHLQFVALPTANPLLSPTILNVSSTVNSLNSGYDGIVVGNKLFLSWEASASTIDTAFVNSSLAVSSMLTDTGNSASFISLTADTVNTRVYVSFIDNNTNNGYSFSIDYNLNVIMTKTQIITSIVSDSITSAVVNGVLNVFYEVFNDYGFTGGARSDFINKLTVTPPATVGAGTISATSTMLRSVGLASKAFIGPNNTIYMLVAYGPLGQTPTSNNSNQPSYFLVDSNGNIYMRLAYSNGGGYIDNQALPNVNTTVLNGVTTYNIPYLITDFLTTVNKGVLLPTGTPTSAIYTQTGINMAKFIISVPDQYSSEIAGALHLTGGQLWEYDGVRPVEHGFQVWPENIGFTTALTAGAMAPQLYNYQFTFEWTDNAGNLHRSAPSIPTVITTTSTPLTFTSIFASGATSIVVSSASGLFIGQMLTDTTTPGTFQANTTIVSISGTTVVLSLPTTAASATTPGDTISTADTSFNTLFVPTDRLTYKVQPNPIRIVGYRWSLAQQVFYQFTSVVNPTVNDTTVDFVTIIDNQPDILILGQPILYTTGGVVEDIAAPASIASALYKNRLFLIDAEDPNLLWFSKQVIEAVPVEMSDLLTIYVAPTTGSQGSTGPMTALSAMDDKLIIFKKDAIYYSTGVGPDNTGANSDFSDPIYITSSVGTANPNSIVLMPAGLMFQSDKGIWLLGRDLSTKYIGAPVEQYNSNLVVSALAIPGTNQVRFTLNNNLTLMYDYYFDQWATHTNIGSLSSTLYQGAQTYLNKFGQVFQEAANTYVDGSIPVLMSLTTSWINLAGLQGLERFYFANLLGTYFSPFILDVTLTYDYNPSATQSITVLPENYIANWGGEALWGSGQAWGGPGNVFSARMFPERQKCQSFQVSIQEIYDPSLGQSAGAGLTLSGLALIVGTKKGYRTQSAAKSFG